MSDETGARRTETTQASDWPASRDALVAAPRHHKLLLENDHVRVLETWILPGDIVPLHTHRWPHVQYILSWSHMVRYDAEGNVVFDSRTLAQTPAPFTALWSEPLAPHSVENVGTNEIHVIAVEWKR
jgi:hypothetical protein